MKVNVVLSYGMVALVISGCLLPRTRSPEAGGCNPDSALLAARKAVTLRSNRDLELTMTRTENDSTYLFLFSAPLIYVGGGGSAKVDKRTCRVYDVFYHQ